MASHQVIVISELAPRLQSFDAEAAQKFVIEYFSHRNRVGAGQAVVPMSSQIDPSDLDTLLGCLIPGGGATWLADQAKNRRLRPEVL